MSLPDISAEPGLGAPGLGAPALSLVPELGGGSAGPVGPGSNPVGPDAAPAGPASNPAGSRPDFEPSGPGSWACLDWRFLVEDPELGFVVTVGDCEGELAALRALGIPAAPLDDELARRFLVQIEDGAGPVPDTAVIRHADPDLGRISAGLRPGGRIFIIVGGREAKAGPLATVWPWWSWRRRMSRAGIEVEAVYWAYPEVDRAAFWVVAGDRTALRLGLSRQPASRRGRFLAVCVGWLVGLGLAPLVSRQGVLIGRATGGAG